MTSVHISIVMGYHHASERRGNRAQLCPIPAMENSHHGIASPKRTNLLVVHDLEHFEHLKTESIFVRNAILPIYYTKERLLRQSPFSS